MMETILALFVFAILIWYYIAEAIREALYYHFKTMVSKFDFGEHTLFTVQRGVVWLISYIVYFNLMSWYDALIILSAMILMFPFWHDGFYYYMRNFLNNDIYKKKFRDDSTTSTAKLEIKWPLRLIMFIVALIMFIVILSKPII